MKYYSGIGSRTINENIKVNMITLATALSLQGYTLRSGNATGSDQAFADGVVKDMAQIWLPWMGFNQDFQDKYPDHRYRLVGHHHSVGEDDADAWDSIEKFHPKPEALNSNGRCFMARNYRQIVGLGEPDSEFVICWTHDGTDVGGTGQAIRIAKDRGIPVYNLFDMTPTDIFKEIIKRNLIN